MKVKVDFIHNNNMKFIKICYIQKENTFLQIFFKLLLAFYKNRI